MKNFAQYFRFGVVILTTHPTPSQFSLLPILYSASASTQNISTIYYTDETTKRRENELRRHDLYATMGPSPRQYNKSGMPVVHWFVLVIHLCVGYSQKSNGLSSYKNSHLLLIGLRQSFLFFKGPLINKEKESRTNMQNQLTGISPDRGFCDGIWRSHLFTIETHIG